jgi:hypothetical protein
MEKELTGLDTSICSGISDLQNLRVLSQERHPGKVRHQGNRQQGRGREINKIAEQIIWGGGNKKEGLGVLVCFGYCGTNHMTGYYI